MPKNQNRKKKRQLKRKAVAICRQQAEKEHPATDLNEIEQENQRQLKLWEEHEKQYLSEISTKQNKKRYTVQIENTKEEAKTEKNEKKEEKEGKEEDLSIYGPKNAKEDMIQELNDEILSNLLHDKNNCGFYLKTGICSFGINCKRNHPFIYSKILLFHHMFETIITETKNKNFNEKEYNKELENQLIKFLDDCIPKFSKFGEICNLKVLYSFHYFFKYL